MEETKRQLVSLSGMPFSGVIIGVGDGDFEQMEILDADGEVLRDEEGNEAVRDIVQLVQYDEFANLGERELAMEVLGELPDQFVDYMVMMENEREKIYQPVMTVQNPTGVNPEELKSSSPGQEATMNEAAQINTGRNTNMENAL